MPRSSRSTFPEPIPAYTFRTQQTILELTDKGTRRGGWLPGFLVGYTPRRPPTRGTLARNSLVRPFKATRHKLLEFLHYLNDY